MSESQTMFEEIWDEVPYDPYAKNYGYGLQFKPNIRCFKSNIGYGDKKALYLYPETGGCIMIYEDGTWAGDVAPWGG